MVLCVVHDSFKCMAYRLHDPRIETQNEVTLNMPQIGFRHDVLNVHHRRELHDSNNLVEHHDFRELCFRLDHLRSHKILLDHIRSYHISHHAIFVSCNVDLVVVRIGQAGDHGPKTHLGLGLEQTSCGCRFRSA